MEVAVKFKAVTVSYAVMLSLKRESPLTSRMFPVVEVAEAPMMTT